MFVLSSQFVLSVEADLLLGNVLPLFIGGAG